MVQAQFGRIQRPAERMLRHAAYGIGLIALVSGAVNALILVSPLYMFQIFDRVLLTFHVETLLYLSLLAAIGILALALFDGLRGVAVARLGRWWDETARNEILDAALTVARRVGTSPGSALEDLQKVRGFVGGPALLPFFDAPWTPLFILGIFLLHPLLGFLALFSALVLLCFAIANDLFSRLSLGGLNREQVLSGILATTALRNADVVHAMGMQAAVLGRYGRQQRTMNDTIQKGAERMALVAGASKAVRIGVQVAILGLGAWLVTRHELTAGGMIAASIILGRALAPVEQAIGSWRSFTAAREAHGRIRALLESLPPAPQPTALPAPVGRLTVEGASLVMPGQDRPALRGVSFTLEPGTVMAVIGASAAGKSTLCRILVGSWAPTAGHVRLDGAALIRWRDEDRGRYVGYLPQTIELFGGTVRENIARFGESSDEAVVEAAMRAGCHEMVLRLPNGYDTEIGEAGAFLSGGQRQRIGLARALLGEPRLVVLDEPNANLDQEGEGALIAAIVELKQRGVTVVLVSHRVATMRVVDVISVLKEGAMEAFGPRDAILEALRPVPQQPVPKQMAAAQSSGAVAQ